ncbi:MAG: hypothetical protein JEZ00_13665 [Anaerolineaceae bacterium]|nr:hypothetical protein [Anaerolineaceae bacterium]
MRLKNLLIIVGLLLVNTACQAQQSGAVEAVESYVQALVDENQERLLTISCADWEETALTELDAFIGVTASVKDMNCSVSGEAGNAVFVTCTGNIEATYNNEERQLPLDVRSFRVVQEQGNWLVCGYQEAP